MPRRTLVASLVLATILGTSAGVAVPVGAQTATPLTAQQVVQELTQLAADSTGAISVDVLVDADVPEVVTFRADSAAEIAEIKASVQNLPGVLDAAERQIAVALDDPLIPQQWSRPATGLSTINPAVNGAGVTIAFVDSGIAVGHQDFVGRVLPGRVFATGDPADGATVTGDVTGHGTHVAGVAAAGANNVGVRGVAPAATILPVRVFANGAAGAFAADIAAGILWAHSQGAQVINLSLGGSGAIPPVIEQAVTYVTTTYVPGTTSPSIVVAAAGNSGANVSTIWPASHPNVVAVAASDPSDAIASFSSRGNYVDVAAPGVDIVSTCRTSVTSYCLMTGTSQAAPFVAGMAALFVQQGKTNFLGAVTATAKDVDASGVDVASGFGRVDVPALLSFNSAVVFVNPRMLAINPARLYDSRLTGARLTGLGDARSVAARGQLGVPNDASSVVLNLTAVNGAAPGYLVVYACDSGRPNVSSVNFDVGQIRASLQAVQLGASGTICVESNVPSDFVVDVVGAQTLVGTPAVGTQYGGLSVARVYDSRTVGVPLVANQNLRIDLNPYSIGLVVQQFMLNVTAIGRDTDAWIAVFPCDSGWQGNSNVNVKARQVAANAVLTRSDLTRGICVRSNQSVDVAIDIFGEFRESGSPSTPYTFSRSRLLDTRGTGAVIGGSLIVRPTGEAPGVHMMVSVIAVGAQSSGYVSVVNMCSGTGAPAHSNLNYARGDTVANSMIVQLDGAGQLCLYVHGTTDIVIDKLAIIG